MSNNSIWNCAMFGYIDKLKYLVEVEGIDVNSKNINIVRLLLLFSFFYFLSFFLLLSLFIILDVLDSNSFCYYTL